MEAGLGLGSCPALVVNVTLNGHMNDFALTARPPLLWVAVALLFCLLLWRLTMRRRKYRPAKRAEKILEALRDRCDIRIVYWSDTQRRFVKEVVTPESLEGVYMNAHDQAQGITRKFNITRIREIVVYPHPALGSAMILRESQRNLYFAILSLLVVVAGLLGYLRYEFRPPILSASSQESSAVPTKRREASDPLSNSAPTQVVGNSFSNDVLGASTNGNEAGPLDARLRSSRAYYDQAYTLNAGGDYDGVISYCTKAIDSDPYYAQAYCLRALAHAMKGELDVAITDSTKAVELNPRYSLAYYLRGGARDEKGESAAAVADYTEAIHINPQFADAYNARAWAQYRRGEFDPAIEDVNQAIQLNPKSANAYDTRGWTKFAIGDKDGALADCSRAVQLDPQSAVGYNSQGLLHYIAGEYDEAVLAWNQAVVLSPTVRDDLKPWIEKAREHLRR